MQIFYYVKWNPGMECKEQILFTRFQMSENLGWSGGKGTATDIERRSKNSYTALCNSVVSHEAPIGVFGFLLNRHTETNANKMHQRYLRAVWAVFYECLSSCSDHSTYTPDKLQLFWSGETRIPPTGVCAWIKRGCSFCFWDIWSIPVRMAYVIIPPHMLCIGENVLIYL